MLLPFLSLCLMLLFISTSSAPAPTTSSAYEVLRSNGLPIGLLPKGIKDFSIDGDGRFEAWLDAPCTATFESEVRYNVSIAGNITVGQIAGLSGVAAQDLFLWFPVRAIRLDNDTSGIIHFDVGVVDKRYPLSLFEVPPDCSPVSSSDAGDARLREGSNFARIVSKSYSGKLRDELDQDDARRADI